MCLLYSRDTKSLSPTNALLSEDGDTSHYDMRYYHGVVPDDERTNTQSHMIRAYLKFFRDHDLDTWIAHGTLIGWWWNGKVCIKVMGPKKHH